MELRSLSHQLASSRSERPQSRTGKSISTSRCPDLNQVARRNKLITERAIKLTVHYQLRMQQIHPQVLLRVTASYNVRAPQKKRKVLDAYHLCDVICHAPHVPRYGYKAARRLASCVVQWMALRCQCPRPADIVC